MRKKLAVLLLAFSMTFTGCGDKNSLNVSDAVDADSFREYIDNLYDENKIIAQTEDEKDYVSKLIVTDWFSINIMTGDFNITLTREKDAKSIKTSVYPVDGVHSRLPEVKETFYVDVSKCEDYSAFEKEVSGTLSKVNPSFSSSKIKYLWDTPGIVQSDGKANALVEMRYNTSEKRVEITKNNL